MEHDTIAALSSPAGRGGIGIIRISGSSACSILKKVIIPLPRKMEPRKQFHGFIHDRRRKIDECLFSFFPAPHSFTGEDIVEISLHSNPYLIEEALSLLFRHGARMALAGEFSYRAFKNGKIDLLQAEAVNDLIQANSRYHARLEFAALEGKLSKQVEAIRAALIDLAVQIETSIEFQEDQHLGKIAITKRLTPVVRSLKALLGLSRFTDVLSQGLKVVIAGKVNSGKSTLFNALLQEERSIISSIPGTTRDFIKERLQISGIPFDITDIAGLQKNVSGRIEEEGISRSRLKIKEADAVIFILDASRKVEEIDRHIYSLISGKRRLLVINKIDIAKRSILEEIKKQFPEEKAVRVSAKLGTNLDSVSGFLRNLTMEYPESWDGVAVNLRQKNILEKLLHATEAISAMIHRGNDALEVIAEDIRSALRLAGELTGEITSEDLLKEIFGRFCIGK